MIFETKEDIELKDLGEMQPALLILLTHTVLYCQEYNLPLKITSLKSDRKNVRAASKTHETGRAVDISTMGWTEYHINRFVFLTNRYYADIAAISASDYKPRAAIYHDVGHGAHIHLQVKPNAKTERFVTFN
jgi:hypothetical protein